MSSAVDLHTSTIFDLRGRIALVSGGGTGIGLMIAGGLAANGARVYIGGRRKEVLERVADEWATHGKGIIIPFPLDVSSRESIIEAKTLIEQKEGKLHILVNNAGVSGPLSEFLNSPDAPENANAETLGNALFNDDGPDAWTALYKINTFSIYYMTTAFLGLLDKGSRDFEGYTSSVVNITSISGILKIAQRHFAYNSSKAAASHLTKMLATEIALKGIPVRVNSIAPGPFASEMTLDTITGPEELARVAQSLLPVPAGRSGSAGDIAGTVIYLSSLAGCYTNGQEIVVDGGYTAVNPSTA
ncbi:short-chain dehydrogenase [Russula ochroleuca]|jgi:NAD(P)-dependent dehydrogenase (short-subunit alcohol dehydrogenase family)|uniref:Short-chain dehydrogenase n=1 Tax=Russula ochroleuca TaxID=152965 RepID=A0A9P5MZF0_9AGAM|nr:short-chain dehydrogenase [Russula ochroleuca]KAF8482401.1 short-chain dehydrogenase [Russula ochroleuca]